MPNTYEIGLGEAMLKTIRKIPTLYLVLCGVVAFSSGADSRAQVASPIANAIANTATVSPKSYQFPSQAIQSTSTPFADRIDK